MEDVGPTELLFSNFKPASEGARTIPLWSDIGQDWEKEEFDCLQCLSNPQLTHYVLRQFLHHPDDQLVRLGHLHVHGDDTKERVHKIIIDRFSFLTNESRFLLNWLLF